MPETVRIGAIGAGGIFRSRHFPALSGMDDAEVVAIANRSEESARAIAEEFDLGADAMDDPHALVERDDVDAVMVGTWPYRHHPFGMAALDAGKHTFVQARMARNLREAKELHARAEETDLATQICPSPMAMEADPYVRELVDDGFLGELYHVRGSVRSGSRHDPDLPLHWRDVERYQGVNALAVGILIEVVHRWFGHAERVSARAATNVAERPLPDGEGTGPVERPDAVSVHCRMESGATASFDLSSVTHLAPSSRIEAYGSDGTLIYDLDEGVLLGAGADDDELAELSIPEEARGEWTVERDFVDAVRHGGSPRATFREGVRYMEFTEAVFRSVETGGEVALPLVA